MKFLVQHFVFCEAIDYRDRSRPHRNTILDGVDYVFGIPPGTEFPFDPEEFWLFARLYLIKGRAGGDSPLRTPPLWIVCCWIDPQTDEEIEAWTRELPEPVTFRRSVADRSWAFRNPEGEKTYRFPHAGLYVFKLGYWVNRGTDFRVKAREYISLEVQS
jgi:hypothetical protein